MLLCGSRLLRLWVNFFDKPWHETYVSECLPWTGSSVCVACDVFFQCVGRPLQFRTRIFHVKRRLLQKMLGHGRRSSEKGLKGLGRILSISLERVVWHGLADVAFEGSYTNKKLPNRQIIACKLVV